MCTHEQQQNHKASSFEHHVNHQHINYRCYIRTPDMRCKIHSIATSQSISQLKQEIKTLLSLEQSVNPQQIKLIVNETELTSEMNLALHIYQNAIIHILVHPQAASQFRTVTVTSLKIKEPPIDCPCLELENLSSEEKILEIKSKIIQLYKEKAEGNQIGDLSVSELYLVHGGRILADDRTLGVYTIAQNDILYVVNGRVYAREVTKQEADRRIQQIKNQKPQAQSQQIDEQSQNPTSSILNQMNDQVFNIIQNIVHDEDSEVEGEVADDLVRSQKIIHRYDSLRQDIHQFQNPHAKDQIAEDMHQSNEQHENRFQVAQTEQKVEQVEQSPEQEQVQIQQTEQPQQKQSQAAQNEQPTQPLQYTQPLQQTLTPEPHSTEQKQTVHKYLDEVSQKIVSTEDEPFSEPSNNEQQQNIPTSQPTNDEEQLLD